MAQFKNHNTVYGKLAGFFILLVLLLPFHAAGQLTVNTSVTANQLIQSLIGNGLTVSNVSLNCNAGAYGTFSNGSSTNLGMNNGILLTTGSAAGVVGANNSSQDVSMCYGTTVNDPDLTALDPTANNDVCILEFDVIPKCDTLSISFVFASEEYPVYVNSINDLFGFFVTGLNPSGGNYSGLNIATLPTGQYVSINNVNNGNTNSGPCTNCQYYIDNSAGLTIQYNGMTTVLTSSIGMVPCTSYHFKIAIADASDCILDSGVFIDLMQCTTAFTFSTSSQPDVCNSCSGSATVTPTGGNPPYTYQWLPTGGTNATATGLCAGTYTVLISDQSSCGIPDTAFVTVGNQGSITLASVPTTPLCFGDCNGSLSVTPQGGNSPFTYVWSNGDTTSNPTGLCAGTYTVTVSDAGGCTNTYSYVLTQPVQLSLALSGNDSICSGVSTTITANAAGGTGIPTISWNNSLPNGSSQTVSPSTTTTYISTVTDANGCTAQDTFIVTVNPSPTAAFTNGPDVCAPGTIQFTDNSTGATNYQWNFGDPSSPGNTSTAQNPVFTYNTAGTYNVFMIATNQFGCSDTMTVNSAVTIFPQPTAAASVVNPVVSELAPDVSFIDQSNGGTSCVFYFGDGDSINTCNFGTVIHTYPSAGTYTAMFVVTSTGGCSDTLYLTILVENESTIYVPNAFTPNGNGGNEIFYAYGTAITDFNMLVFDRWGNLIYQGNDINKGWDGTYHNNPCQEDVYVWKITFTDSRGKKQRMIGHVSLVR